MTVVLPIISVDDHVLEAPGIWVDRLPRKYLDAGPRVERRPRGTSKVDEMGRTFDTPGIEGPPVDYWHFEDTFWALTRSYAAPGFTPEETDRTQVTFDDIRPGCFKVADRLADMDFNQIEASLCFPNYIRFAGQRFAEAKDLQRKIVRATAIDLFDLPFA